MNSDRCRQECMAELHLKPDIAPFKIYTVRGQNEQRAWQLKYTFDGARILPTGNLGIIWKFDLKASRPEIMKRWY